MKTPRFLLAVLAFLGLAFTANAADPVPTLPIASALKIAQDYLKGKAGTRVIVAITLEKGSLLGDWFWYAKWSAPINDGDTQVSGLRIAMNGGITRVGGTIGSGTASPLAAPAGQRPIGARNIR